MNAKLLSLFACVAFVAAQSSEAGTPTASGLGPIPTLPPCVSDCVTSAASDAQCDPTAGASCVCTDAFINAVAPCIAACSSEEQQAAAALQSALCPNGGASSAESVSPTPTASPSSSGASAPTSRPLTTTPIASVTRPSGALSTPPTTGSATTAGTSASTSPNAALPMAAQGVWAMAAGVLGFAVAL